MSSETTQAVPWTTQVLRVTSSLVLLCTLGQGLLAGLFVTGDVDLLTVHSALGSAIALVALVQFLTALLERRARKRMGEVITWRLTVLCGFVLVLVSVQIGLGMARVVAPHMFLGVVSAAVAMLVLLVVLMEASPAPVVTVRPGEGK
ncbi:hypothetical protein SBI_09783 [Streptomyces bingchenggensis BCW-1]|uniref:Integral membrane protein n=1 Tax=Streptomyces bingchenggensis (strain BCW-1) TaxID=749414 RepID=D7CBM4_STRBB|nr:MULTISPECIES: hypothetical protein [Streptomyces]ADI12901.1 hypothetical protein SBI_09783 [Streptomyces bingchenggensis BCW-1]